ncbi:MAG: FG-GAP repeat domain-containing protein, partial [Verrucomicrobiota bacterium]
DHGGGVAAADVDGDGRPDLFFTSQLGRCELWRNAGGGRWEDWTARMTPVLTDVVAVGAAFADVDNDGDPDLFVTTVRHGNRLMVNEGGGVFRDGTEAAGLVHSGHSAGVVFGDFDRDGQLDLLVTDVGRYTTGEQGPGGFHRAITNAFHGHLYPERTEYKTLYRNVGGGRFRDVTGEVGLRDGSWSGEATLADLNEDGYPDLYLVNMQGDDRYYENQGGRAFVEKTAEHFPRTPWGAMGVKFFDFNNDGRMDLYVTDMHSDMTPRQTLDGLRFPARMEKEKSDAYCSARWDESFLQGSSNNVFGNAFYVNLGGGRFMERSDALGLETYWPWGPSVGDFNADGFADVFVTAGMGHPFRYAINSLLLNEGGRRFVDGEFLVGLEPRAGGRLERTCFTLDCDGPDAGHPLCAGRRGQVPVAGTRSSRSAVALDLDGDGDLDLVTQEQYDRPQVLVNDLSTRRAVRFLQVRLRGTRSNRDGLG